MFTIPNLIPVDCCTLTAVPSFHTEREIKEEGKTAMYDDFCDSNLTADERKTDYLLNELHGAASRKREAAYNAYNMDGTPYPDSPKMLVEMIQKGHFKFRKSHLNDDGSWRDENGRPFSGYSPSCLTQFLRWEDPAKTPDEKGYRQATDAIDAACNDAEREIRIGTPVEGLKVLKDFEAKTFH